MLSVLAAALSFQAPLSKIAQQSKAFRQVETAAMPVLASVVLLVCASPAYAGDAGLGKSIFEGNCRACHVGGRNVIEPVKTLEQTALEEYLDGGATETAVAKQVANGKNAMPAFGGRLSEEDIANVATFVISTAKAGWD